jgi:hypothetical protein
MFLNVRPVCNPGDLHKEQFDKSLSDTFGRYQAEGS